MLSAESQVDVTLGLWKNIGLTNIKVSSSLRSLGSEPEGECVSASGPEDAFDGCVQGKSPCEERHQVKVLVDGRAESRTGVHVESEVVLKCEGNNNEGACDMLCWM